MLNYQKGDIISVDLGTPPIESKGHEQAFTRPCVVLKSFNHLKLLIVIPFTTKNPSYNSYTVVKVLKGSGGLTTDSFALCHQIKTISIERVVKRIGRLDQKNLIKIQAVLIDTLEL